VHFNRPIVFPEKLVADYIKDYQEVIPEMTLTQEELAKIDTDFEAIQEIIANAPEYTTQTSYREECKDVEISVPSIGTSS